jgi:DNA-binding NarL/FixJ family response regulator
MDKKWSVFIAETHRLFREGLRAMLNIRPDIQIVGETEDGIEAIRYTQSLKPDLVILDLNLPRMSGISAIRTIKGESPEIKILVLTDDHGGENITEALQLGADGYCLKDISREELFWAIDTVMAGKPYLSPQIVETILRRCLMCLGNAGSDGPWSDLSPREKEILKLIGEGFSIREISESLYLSRRTVEKHRYNIMKKLNIHRTSALVATAVENHLAVTR